MLTLALIHFFMVSADTPACAQQADTINIVQTSTKGTIKATSSSPQKIFSEIARYLYGQRQVSSISYSSRKINHRIDSAQLFEVPGGESPAALFALPGYEADYILTINSYPKGFFKTRVFAPTGVFLDSSFRPTHFLAERKFQYTPATQNTDMLLETEVTIDSERKEDKYLLIYTTNKTGRLVSYDKYVMRSAQGIVGLELHLR